MPDYHVEKAGRVERVSVHWGDFAVDKHGFQVGHKAITIQWQDGRQVVVSPDELVSGKPRLPTPPWSQSYGHIKEMASSCGGLTREGRRSRRGRQKHTVVSHLYFATENPNRLKRLVSFAKFLASAHSSLGEAVRSACSPFAQAGVHHTAAPTCRHR
jgi:hypothetical protein